jgi:hypothetical protein
VVAKAPSVRSFDRNAAERCRQGASSDQSLARRILGIEAQNEEAVRVEVLAPRPHDDLLLSITIEIDAADSDRDGC